MDPLRVLPVFLVPSDQDPPAPDRSDRLLRHVRWTRDRYRELLDGTTFALEDRVEVVRSAHPLLAFQPLPEDGVPHMVRELFLHHATDRDACPYVYVIVLVNPCENRPVGGGRPFNGGFNRGGGLAVFSSWFLDHAPIFQSTLQHELGHAFGLPHVDVYGYPLREGVSIMSYNERHWSRGFEPAETPGELIPEDRRGLALNQRAFPGLTFEAPAGTPLGKVVELGPMTIPDGPPPPVDSDAQGYELFLGGARAGHAPDWNREQAIANLEWNRKNKPGVRVDGRFGGRPLP